MSGVFTYPWVLAREGVDEACADLADCGVDTISLAAHYHSVRAFSPRFPEALFETREGGCYFDPGDAFDGAAIRPVRNEVEGLDDPLADVVDAADSQGLAVNAWTVYLHNSRLGREYPEYRLEDAFGNPHEHAFCPSNEAVREYYATLTRAVADRGVAAVGVESGGYPTAFHEHDTRFGHAKRQVLTSEAEERLFSQCFCDACRCHAREHAVDLDEAREVVRGVVRDSFERPDSDPMELGDLTRERPVLGDLFDFRASVVDEFIGDIADAARAGGAAVVPYAFSPADGWKSGLTHRVLERHADRLKVLCYVADPAEARRRLDTFRRSVDLPLDAAVTLDPAVLDTEAVFRSVVDAVRAGVDGDVTVYNHAMLTDTQLDWVARAFS